MGLMNSKFRPVAPARLDERGHPRRPVLLQPATVRPGKSRPIEARLLDLSAYGCRLLTTRRMKEGIRIWLRFADADPVAATAIWCDGEHMGCRFDEAIDRRLFRSLTLSAD